MSVLFQNLKHIQGKTLTITDYTHNYNKNISAK